MTRRNPSLRLRFLAWPILFGFVLQPLAAVQSAHAAVRFEDRDSIGQARPVAPAEGEHIGAGAVRFAFELPKDVAQVQVVVARAPFDPSGWKAVPTESRYHVAQATAGLLSLDAFDLAIEGPSELWWAIATTDRTTGRFSMSPVRSFTALPRFTNRVAPSPYVLETRRGVLGAADVVVPAGPPRLRLAAGYTFAPSIEAEPSIPAELSSSARRVTDDPAQPGAQRSYLVQYAAPPSEAERTAIAEAGGAVFSYIPDQAFLVRMSEEARARLAAQGRALWIGEYEPAYKMSPLLTDATVPKSGQYIALVFPDADAQQAAQALGVLGYTVEAVSDNGINKLVRFRAPAAGLAAAAGLPQVAWVEPVAIKTVFNGNAQWVLQTNVLNDRRVWTLGLRGQNQVVMTSDSGINTGHNMFVDGAVPLTAFGDYPTHRKIIGYKKGSNSPAVAFGDHGGANSYHGSHTAGSMVGNDDALAASVNDGMAKDAKIYFMDVSGVTLANSVVPFDDLNDLFLPPYVGNAGGAARISSNSWGAPVNGAYDLNSMQVDQFMWSHPDFYIAFSNGNSGAVGTIGSPASSKNSAGMGGTQNGVSANLIYTSTSRGPTADGRRKPTFCAPGQGVTSSTSGTATYASLSGTSMASPTGTGSVVLMRQYLTDGWYPTGAAVPANSFLPSAALLKAMAINAADNGVTGFTAPDNNVGFGRLKIDNVLYFPGDARKLLIEDNTDGLGQGQYIEYQVNVTDALQALEVSLCWTDYPGTPAAGVQLVNNLDLTVTNGVSTYKGNVFAGGVSTTGGVADNLNVEENVLVAAPSAGLWTIRVAAPAVPVGPQPFGLCITGGVGQNAGALALDRAEYGSTSTMDLQVVDTDASSPLTVHVTSPTEAAGEDVTLTGANGVFNGTLTLTPLGSTPANGVLSVSNGDALTATYSDVSPVAVLTANATVSFATPVITNVKATSQGASGTLVTFNTNLNASGTVHYGLTPALELGSVNGVGARLAHQVLVTGLTPGASYYYDVEATALNGNSARDDLGGVHHRFTAKGSGDLLLVVGETGFPRLSTWQNALAALNYDYDLWIGPLADNPDLGNLVTGMRSYKAVLWQAGFDQYPPFDDTQRTVVTDYINGGGRIATIGHDIAWALGDLTSGFGTVATQQWLAGTLRTTWQADPTTWDTNTGIALDPISGSYVAGVPYIPVRAGGAGDEVDVAASPGGATSYTWRNNDVSPDDIGFRWESSVPNGGAGTALWGGTPSRLVNMFFEWTAMDPPHTGASAIRNDILGKTILWLIGRERPTVLVTSPNGGETLAGNSASVDWNETIGAGHAAAGRTVEYSIDGGDSWVILTTSAGPSPYNWDLTTVPNSTQALVRVRVTDNGAPALSQGDVSNAFFTIARPGGDIEGPVVVAGSIASAPNPIVRPNAANLTATVSDQARGASAIVAAEWSFGNSPAGAGLGTPLSLGGSGVTVGVNGALDTTPFLTGSQKIWVRAQDASGNWGPATALTIQVNGPDPVGVTPIPAIAFLSQNTPNPFGASTNLRFGLPTSGRADLGVYSVQGRLVKRLVAQSLDAGEHVATWDGRDESGRRVSAGVYYYVLVTPQGRLDKRMIALP